VRHEQPYGECAVLGETAFLKIDGKTAWRDHGLIVLATDGHWHSRITQDFNECLGGGGLDRVHAKRGVSIGIQLHLANDNPANAGSWSPFLRCSRAAPSRSAPTTHVGILHFTSFE
jgi:hypothetical protein